MAWQLETWLRSMVYVELKATQVDWTARLGNAEAWPSPAYRNDQRLEHMASSDSTPVSYLTFGQLWNVISDQGNWGLFASYFPPKGNIDTKIEEVRAIRNRIAHCRKPHPQDEARMRLFLHDLEPGLRRFRDRYCVQREAQASQEDRLTPMLEANWRRYGYKVELCKPNGSWLYACDHHRSNPLVHAEVLVLLPPTHRAGSDGGVIYDLRVGASHLRRIDFDKLFHATHDLHEQIIHILRRSDSELHITVPAVLGPPECVRIVAKFLSEMSDCQIDPGDERLSPESQTWPEYVVPSDDALAAFSGKSSEPIFMSAAPADGAG